MSGMPLSLELAWIVPDTSDDTICFGVVPKTSDRPHGARVWGTGKDGQGGEGGMRQNDRRASECVGACWNGHGRNSSQPPPYRKTPKLLEEVR